MAPESHRAPHLLTQVLAEAIDGRFPPADAVAEVVAPSDDGAEAVLALTAHAFVATALPPEVVRAQRIDGLGRAVEPEFLLWLAGPGGYVGSHDVVLGRLATEGHAALAATERFTNHNRVGLARSRRQDVMVLDDPHGIVTLGRNPFGWLELGVEVFPEKRLKGHGRRLIEQTLKVPPSGEPLFAHVAPGNAASLRAFLAAGFRPLGSIVMIRPTAGRLGQGGAR
jgi:hypothetical protein